MESALRLYTLDTVNPSFTSFLQLEHTRLAEIQTSVENTSV